MEGPVLKEIAVMRVKSITKVRIIEDCGKIKFKYFDYAFRANDTKQSEFIHLLFKNFELIIIFYKILILIGL